MSDKFIAINIDTHMTDMILLLMSLQYVEEQIIPGEIKQTTKRIERSSKNLIRTGRRSGKKYSGRKHRHRSSAPGEAPRSQTGLLARSISSRFRHIATTGYTEGRVGSNLPYALYLEKGADRKNNILEPRPWLMPTMKKEIPVMIRNLKVKIGAVV